MDRRILELSKTSLILSVKDFLMPRVCAVCGRSLLVSERHLCLKCLGDLPRTLYENRLHNPMADMYNSRFAPGPYEPYQAAAALFFYSAVSTLSGNKYGRIPQELKYFRNFSVGRHFARMLGEVLALSPVFRDVDAIIPVPLHWTRRLERGYNQSEVIARGIAESFPAAVVDCRTLVRLRRTHTQTRMHSAMAKAENVRGAFRARKTAPYRHVLIVDDVFTSGGTAAACHDALRAIFGPEVRISVATLACIGSR
ncbi:MAG: ComF family protein [Bacteroidales bacterium]|nr:ComF family protein [Bacteroidales bacterium]